MSVYTVLIWLLGGLIEHELYLQFGVFAVSTYLMVELNNSNALLSMYSRMVSCSFMALITMAAFIFNTIEPWVVQLCFIMMYLSLFRSYQDKHAQGFVFYAFLCLGLGSIMFVQILFFVPFLWIMMASNLMAFSARNFWASVFGLIAPYWFLGGYYLIINRFYLFIQHFTAIAQFQPLFQYDNLQAHAIVTFAFLLIVSLTGIIHYQSKIRTRMIYEIFVVMDILSFVFVILQPQHANMLFGIIIVNTSALIAHYISQTHTKITNISFYVLAAVTLLLTIYNIWIPS